LFFGADDADNGKELWMSDGTEAGTPLVKDINPGRADSNPSELTGWNGLLIFAANNGSSGVELWMSDGSPSGTWQVADIHLGPASSNPKYLVTSNGNLYCAAETQSNGAELWSLRSWEPSSNVYLPVLIR
jgi:ELWxxDGT repeat protein